MRPTRLHSTTHLLDQNLQKCPHSCHYGASDTTKRPVVSGIVKIAPVCSEDGPDTGPETFMTPEENIWHIITERF